MTVAECEAAFANVQRLLPKMKVEPPPSEACVRAPEWTAERATELRCVAKAEQPAEVQLCGGHWVDTVANYMTRREKERGSGSGSVVDESPCDVALPKLKAACPRAGGFLERECQVASDSVNAVTVDIEQARPGSVIHFGNPGPEWFLRDDGTLLTMNGSAASFCRGLDDVPTFVGRAMIASAPKRGNTPKTYEGVYGPDGNYLYNDCSEFEIRIGRIYYQALWEHPNSSEEVADRRVARAMKNAGVTAKVGDAIYFKTMNQCMQALTAE
jgi:hypothetical protein